MDLNQENFNGAMNFIFNTPIRAFLDIGGHYITGLFLTQKYFHEFSKTKKSLLAFFSGFSPDFDFLFPGVPHKVATHNLWYAALMGLNASALSSEDLNRTKVYTNYFKSGYDNLKRIATSRYAKLASFGAGLHLCSDSLTHYGDGAKLAYFAMATTMLYLQNRQNNKKSLEELTVSNDNSL